ncbi:MAG TPA: RiPP maturation radical SAM C-methyltransferase [Thermoanaerobaculia bacterium]|nr:RiPP maturation radical SAM C-methyltransferase [Thermoanaerobaculia bacterium]
MYKISLINMPFSNLRLPSIALTQLRSVVERELGERVRVRVLYLNQDFANFMGLELYEGIASALEANNSGLGDWFFRQVAFPDLADNTEAYFKRYFPQNDLMVEARKQAVLGKRAGLERFFQKVIARHQLDGEDLVGMTSMFAQNTACFAMARMIKARGSKTVTVMGGANCEAPMGRELARNVPAVDFVFSGPALISFPELVGLLMAGEADACHRIQGVFSRANADSDDLKGPRAIGRELPIDVPVPLDYESFLGDLKRSFPSGAVEPYLTFETSRGCWWGERSHCTFCGLNGGTMKYRSMPSAQALELFKDLFTRYADRCSRFESVDNILPREYLTEVFPNLTPPPGVSMFYEVKADLKEREMEVLSRAGVTEIQPGIEALATSTLKLMHKGTTSFQNVVFLKNCVRFGVRPAWNLLIGFPGEGEEVYRKYVADIPSMVHLPPPAGAFPVRFDRFSPYYTRAAEYGLHLEPYDFYSAIYPFGEEALKNMAYYFEDRNYRAAYLNEMVPWQGKLNTGVALWTRRWRGADGGLPAELYLERAAEGGVVHDTRSGERVEHRVGELAVRILDFLRGNGWRIADIARHAGVDEAVAAAEVEQLRGLGLLFEENDRCCSLVLDGPRPAARPVSLPLEVRPPAQEGAGGVQPGAVG